MEVKYNTLALVTFEKLANKPFEMKSMFDITVLIYSCYLSHCHVNGHDVEMDYMEFLTWIDDNQSKYKEMYEEVIRQMKLDAQFYDSVDDSSKKK